KRVVTPGRYGNAGCRPIATPVATAAPAAWPPGLGHALRPAQVAAAAGPRILVAEVPPESGAAPAGLLGVLDHGAQAPRVLAPQHLEPAAQALDTLDQGVEGPDRQTRPLESSN